MRRVVALLASLVASAVSVEVPFVAFGTSLPQSGTENGIFRKAGEWLPALIKSGNAHFFVVDELSSSAFAALSGQPAFTPAFSAVHRHVLAAPSSFLAPRAVLQLDDLQYVLGAAAANMACSVVRVGDASSELSRSLYLTRAGGAPGGCTAYITLLSRARLASELAFVESVASALESSGAPFAAVLSAATAADAEATAAGHRFLQATAVPLPQQIPVPQIYATPTILAGLLLSLVLAFFTAVGLQCVASVDTPDVMHSFTLPAGKEY